MPIKVYSTISEQDNQQIIQIYNSIKSPTEMPLEKISGKGGGYYFVIKPDEKRNFRTYYSNLSTKQIHWNCGILVGYYNFPEFTKTEQNRLYYALLQVLGKKM